jgi:hypothetical protein
MHPLKSAHRGRPALPKWEDLSSNIDLAGIQTPVTSPNRR